MTRGKKLKLQYVSARGNASLDNETFKYFRGINELNVDQRGEGPCKFTDESMENLRGIKTLNISGCSNLTSACFVNLRGVKNLDIASLEHLDDYALEQLRGIERLNMNACSGFTDSGMINLRGIKHLDITECTQLTDACFENLRGVHSLNMSNCDQISGDALRNLIGIQELNVTRCLIIDTHLRYLVGVKRLDLLDCHQINGEGLHHVRGVEEINLAGTELSELVDFSPLREARIVCASGVSFNEQMLSNFRRVQYFHSTRCRFFGDASFANFSNFEKFDLIHAELNGISDSAFRHFHSLKRLSLYYCQGAQLTKCLFENLPRSLENLEIYSMEIHLEEEDVDDVVRCLGHVSNLHVSESHALLDRVLECWKLVRESCFDSRVPED